MTDDCTRKPTRLVLLDRDGVVNEDSPDYIKSADEWHPLPGSLAAIVRLNKAGIHTALCSNQAGISRGRLSAQDLADIHLRFQSELDALGGKISLWRFCPHLPDDNCSCRKPNTAMLTDCMDELRIPPSAVAFVGDSIKDMQAARFAHCLPLLVKTGNGRVAEEAARTLGVSEVVDDLAAAAARILHLNAQFSDQPSTP